MTEEVYNERYLQNLIDTQVQESLYLDYKRSDSLANNQRCKNEISKDVSAFANSDGGTIIYGMIESNHIPTSIDGCHLFSGQREWLENVINSTIQPRISGIEIHQIDLTSEPGYTVFIVVIPRSYTAHQANNQRYYKRFNYQSKPMYDYEVRQTMFRGQQPILLLSLHEMEPISLPVGGDRVILKLLLSNKGMITARSADILLFLPRELSPQHQGNWVPRILPRQIPRKLQFYLNINMDDYSPLHPGSEMLISAIGQSDAIQISPNNLTSQNINILGHFEIYAENMYPKYGDMRFNFLNSWLTISIKPRESRP